MDKGQMERRLSDAKRVSGEPPQLDDRVMPSLTPCRDDIVDRQQAKSKSSSKRSVGQKNADSASRMSPQASQAVTQAKQRATTPKRRSPGRWRLWVVALLMVGAASGLYYQNYTLQLEVREQAALIVQYNEKLGSLDKAVTITDQALGKTGSLFEQRLTRMERDLEQLKSTNQRLAPNLDKQADLLAGQGKAVDALSARMVEYDKKLPTIDKTLSQIEQRLGQQVEQHSAAVEQLEARLSTLQADIDQFPQQLSSMTDSMTQQLNLINGAQTALEADVMALGVDAEKRSQEKLEALEEQLLNSKEASAEALAAIEAHRVNQERMNKSVNLFRQQTNSALDQIKTDLRRLKSVN